MKMVLAPLGIYSQGGDKYMHKQRNEGDRWGDGTECSSLSIDDLVWADF